MSHDRYCKEGCRAVASAGEHSLTQNANWWRHPVIELSAVVICPSLFARCEELKATSLRPCSASRRWSPEPPEESEDASAPPRPLLLTLKPKASLKTSSYHCVPLLLLLLLLLYSSRISVGSRVDFLILLALLILMRRFRWFRPTSDREYGHYGCYRHSQCDKCANTLCPAPSALLATRGVPQDDGAKARTPRQAPDLSLASLVVISAYEC